MVGFLRHGSRTRGLVAGMGTPGDGGVRGEGRQPKPSGDVGTWIGEGIPRRRRMYAEMGDSAVMQTAGSGGSGESAGGAGGRMGGGRGGASGGGRMRWRREGIAVGGGGGGGGGAMMGGGGGGAMRGARAGAAAGCGGRRWDGEPVSFCTTSRKLDLSMLYTGGWGGGWSAGTEGACGGGSGGGGRGAGGGGEGALMAEAGAEETEAEDDCLEIL